MSKASLHLSNERKLGGHGRLLLQVIYVLIVALAVAWAFSLPAAFGLNFQRAQYLALFLAFVLSASFLAYAPVRTAEPQTRVPLYDRIAALVGFAAAVYPVFTYERLSLSMHLLPPVAVGLGVVMVILLLEAVRRAAGLPLVIVGTMAILYSFLSEYMPGIFYNRAVSFQRLFMYLYIDPNAILGMPLAISMGIVLAFILFGNTLNRTGAGDFYTNMAAALMGRFSGGAGKISVMASALMGSISGSAVSNVASTGVITIPMMKKSGFKPLQSAAIEASASSGGQILPPVMGATAFLMAEFLNIPYREVVMAALIPALLYFVVVFIYVQLTARRDSIGGLSVGTGRELLRNILVGSVYLLPILVLLYALFHLTLRPERAAFLAILTTIAIHLILSRGRVAGYFSIITDTGRMVLQIGLITAIAGIVIGVLNLTGLGFALTLMLSAVAQIHLLLLLFLVALVSLVLGMGMPTTGVYLVLAVLVAPAMANIGVPDIAAHMFILYFGVFSFLTPPVCFAAFAAATIAGTGPMRTGFESMRVISAAYIIPFAFIYTPELLMSGSTHEVALVATTTAVSLLLLSVGLIGFGRRHLSPIERSVVAVLGMASVICNSLGGWQWHLAALTCCAAGCLIMWRARAEGSRSAVVPHESAAPAGNTPLPPRADQPLPIQRR